MSRIRLYLTTSLILILLSSISALAEDYLDDLDDLDDIQQRIGAGNPLSGKEKSAFCQGCHGEDGNSAISDFPKLAGQYATYIQKQIKDFKMGARQDPLMTDIALTLTNDQDLLDISAYFASQKQMKGAKRVITKAGQRRFQAGNGCQTCHGVNGKGLAPDNPIAPVIGGQHKNYLIKQLIDFRRNARTNEGSGMMGMIADLMSDEQIEEIASYESGL
jgi:cytochrome c553